MGQDENRRHPSVDKSFLEALISGTSSSVFTTVIYQPLELLKTRIQLRNFDNANQFKNQLESRRLTRSAIFIAKSQGLKHLWTGTGASLLRSGPGVGLYYALLNVLQTNFSEQTTKPDSPIQAFCFGLTSRSLVSFVLLPVTVVKVRYESGYFKYPSLSKAIRAAYLNSSGWVGIVPTILRDSLFSGTYYMCYTKLKGGRITAGQCDRLQMAEDMNKRYIHLTNFFYGIISGLIASIATNPFDVVKTHVQAHNKTNEQQVISTSSVVKTMLRGNYLRFFDGLVPRSLRRTLIAATTWTLYEVMSDVIALKRLG